MARKRGLTGWKPADDFRVGLQDDSTGSSGSVGSHGRTIRPTNSCVCLPFTVRDGRRGPLAVGNVASGCKALLDEKLFLSHATQDSLPKTGRAGKSQGGVIAERLHSLVTQPHHGK